MAIGAAKAPWHYIFRSGEVSGINWRRPRGRGLRPISRYLDAKLGWGGVITGEFSVVEIPGGHSDMLLEPQVQLTAAKLAMCSRDLQQQVGWNDRGGCRATQEC